MGDPLKMAMAKVMDLSDEAIRRRMRKSPTGVGPEDLSAEDRSTREGLDEMAEDKASGEGEPKEGELSDHDRARLKELYERMMGE